VSSASQPRGHVTRARRLQGATALAALDRPIRQDLVERGIIDPTKVVRIALENAVSVAGTLLLTEATMTDLPEPKRAEPALASD